MYFTETFHVTLLFSISLLASSQSNRSKARLNYKITSQLQSNDRDAVCIRRDGFYNREDAVVNILLLLLLFCVLRLSSVSLMAVYL